jgi:hypothetical protein
MHYYLIQYAKDVIVIVWVYIYTVANTDSHTLSMAPA